MDSYAQVLELLDTHYPHIGAWVRIVYSYRVVKYCNYAGIAISSDLFNSARLWPLLMIGG